MGQNMVNIVTVPCVLEMNMLFFSCSFLLQVLYVPVRSSVCVLPIFYIFVFVFGLFYQLCVKVFHHYVDLFLILLCKILPNIFWCYVLLCMYKFNMIKVSKGIKPFITMSWSSVSLAIFYPWSLCFSNNSIALSTFLAENL